MSVPIMMPEQQTSIGRRLLGTALSMGGMATGNPALAVAGNAIGSKIAGGSAAEGAMKGATGYAENALARRKGALAQDPRFAIEDGLGALTELPPDDPIRNKYTGVLVKAQMLGSPKLMGGR